MHPPTPCVFFLGCGGAALGNIWLDSQGDIFDIAAATHFSWHKPQWVQQWAVR